MCLLATIKVIHKKSGDVNRVWVRGDFWKVKGYGARVKECVVFMVLIKV